MRLPLFQRDPRDRRYQERLAGSTVVSLLIHALLALFLFSVLASSSQQGTTENVEGGETVTFERRTPLVANQPAATQASVPVPHVARIAPVHHALLAQPQTQPQPQNRHEMAREAPTAPPNPRPIPRQSPQPAPAPTQNIFETQPRNELPAAPVNVPTVAPVAVAIKAPPTVAPSPVPTSAPTAKPSPKPLVRAQPTAKPATPAPAVPSAAPTATAAAVAVRATAAPSASPAPAARASAPPAPQAGVPSPKPTTAAAIAKAPGAAASPGPKAGASPGPHPGAGQAKTAAPSRPIQVPPSPSPASRATPAPKATAAANNLNAKLRALLPSGPVNPTSKQYSQIPSLRGRLDPTPPPEVLAKTKYIYDVRGTGNEARIRMWVTDAHKAGPTTICTGWLVRYPEPERGGYAYTPSNVHVGPANGTQIAIGGNGAAEPPLGPFDAGIAPIVDGIVSQPCDGRRLVPYAASPAPSP